MMALAQNKNVVNYVRPAKEKVDSLIELSKKSLDDFCENWRKYNHPKSYIFPPIFKFKNPDVSKEALDKLQESRAAGTKEDPFNQKDRADRAELVVFKAVRKLIQDEIRAPFMAFQSFDLKLIYKAQTGKLDGELVKLFRSFSWSTFQQKVKEAFDGYSAKFKSGNGEYDFVLIGPEIGIVIIEVKGSLCNHVERFREHFNYGIGQLKASSALIYLLEEFSGIKMHSDVTVRNILFLANLERERFKTLKDELTPNEVTELNRKTENITLWFKEDKENDAIHEIGQPPLFSVLKNFLLDGPILLATPDLFAWYEAFGATLAGISSKLVLDRSVHLSESKSILSEHVRIVKQNPRERQSPPKKKIKNNSRSTATLLEKASASTTVESQAAFKNLEIIFLSPDQQKSINGENRQFLIGPAGTGKTIILQAKALEMLEKGESVFVLATKNSLPNWASLFDKYDSDKFDLVDLRNGFKFIGDLNYVTLEEECTKAVKTPGYFDGIRQHLKNLMRDVGLPNSNRKRHASAPASSSSESVTNAASSSNDQQVDQSINHGENQLIKFCQNFALFIGGVHHVFIDDALGDDCLHRDTIMLALLFMTILASEICSQKIMWIALDPNQYGMVRLASTMHEDIKWKTVDELFRSKQEGSFSISILKQVMRCSTNVFESTYCETLRPFSKDSFIGYNPSELEPILGHNIFGRGTIQHILPCENYDDALTKFSAAVSKEVEGLKKLLSEKLPFDSFAIVLTGAYLNNKTHATKVKRTLQAFFPYHRIVRLGEQNNFSSEKTIILANWTEVYSLEWALIVHGCFCFSDKQLHRHITVQRCEKYVARSRATVALVEIVLNF